MALTIVHILVATLLIGAILLQSQGGGLSTAFGGGMEMYRSKRSLEKVLFQATIFLTMVFAVLSVILLIPRS